VQGTGYRVQPVAGSPWPGAGSLEREPGVRGIERSIVVAFRALFDPDGFSCLRG
jgi:hypothetical protein